VTKYLLRHHYDACDTFNNGLRLIFGSSASSHKVIQDVPQTGPGPGMASLGGSISAGSRIPPPKPAPMKPVPVLERLALRSQLLVAALTDNSTDIEADV
jgi:hypothetical protein